MKPFKVPHCAGNGIRRSISIFCSSLLAMSALGNSLPGDQHWDNQFGYVGTSDQLYTINVLGGKVYVGGFLTAAGNTAANFIAGYDGTNWFQLNNGMSGYFNDTYVWAMANDGTNLYVGGLFTNADNSGAINIARWDGSSFHPLAGGPPNSVVTAIKITGPSLYAAGIFSAVGTVSANAIAQWNGATWQPLGTGLSGGSPLTEGLALEYDGTYLYAGGIFSQAGGVPANNIARWNGTSWSAMGSGLSGSVLALCSLNGNLYAGGTFTNSSLGITNLACWNGSSWSPVGLGPDNTVAALATDGTNLYVGGFFKNINGMPANRVAMWNGSTWSALGTGIQGFGVGSQGLNVYRMALDSQGRLFVAGNFSQAGSVAASYVAGWNGTNWFNLGATSSKGMSHFIGNVQGLFSDGTNVYAGGTFTEAGGQIVDQVGRWDGTNWWAMGASTPGVVPKAGPDAFAIADGVLYAGGFFTNLGPNAVNYIGYWNGTSWQDIGGTDAKVQALVYDGTYLWIGGAFTNVDGGGYTPGLAFYQDGSWYTQGSISGGSQFVSALGWDGINFNLYAGGNFTNINSFSGPVPANNIAFFDENNGEWIALGSGVNGTVNAICVTTNDIVYVGGNFTIAGGVTVNGIAKWNATTSTWSALGSGVTYPSGLASVNALAMNGNILYVAGSFTNAGGVYAPGLAAWNGTTWSGFGSGLYSSVFNNAGSADALLVNSNDVYVGGNFNWAGNKPSAFFAHWNSQLNFYPTPHPFLSRGAWLPAKQFQFRLGGTSGESYILQASTNFAQWTPLITNSATLYDYTDTNASHFPHRFYRAVLGP